MKIVLCLSAMGISVDSLKRRMEEVFSVGIHSPVRLDSSNIRSAHDKRRQSAGTLEGRREEEEEVGGGGGGGGEDH